SPDIEYLVLYSHVFGIEIAHTFVAFGGELFDRPFFVFFCHVGIDCSIFRQYAIELSYGKFSKRFINFTLDIFQQFFGRRLGVFCDFYGLVWRCELCALVSLADIWHK
ncbi:MAG: hypothetical protein AAB726_03220, partial [Patescibacteria group bacterium]